jgi:hypothetical protein
MEIAEQAAVRIALQHLRDGHRGHNGGVWHQW